MTNHVHLLITPSTPDGVSRVMQDIGRDYVRTLNRTWRRTGTLWEGRFKSPVIDSDRYCIACYRYIELNPVRAGMIRHPRNYPWSSYHSNALGRHTVTVTPHDCWLLLCKDDHARQAACRDLFSETPDEQDIAHIRESISTGLPTGNDRFRRYIEQALSVRPGQGKRGRPPKNTPGSCIRPH